MRVSNPNPNPNPNPNANPNPNPNPNPTPSPSPNPKQRHVCGPPTFTLAPPAGTALLFGGQATHAAQPVTAGERCVFVGSFTPTSFSESY